MTNSPRTLRHRLSDQAVHIDFLRLRCGSEERFLRGIQAVRGREGSDPIHPFIAFSEWDALLVVPCSQLYPPTLTDIYSNADVAASVSGTSGYFAYLWEHDVNLNWRETLSALTDSGPTILMSLRFADWFRQDVGLGAEILFCNRLNALVKGSPDISAIVAHSLGWNDAMLLIHAANEASSLIPLLKGIRLMTLGDCIDHRTDILLSQPLETPVFAASYSHLLGGLEAYVGGNLSFGSLHEEIESARLLIRVAPPHEQSVRAYMQTQAEEIGTEVVDSEMGHYSLSIDMSAIAKRRGETAIRFIAATRKYIGGLGDGRPDSYAETTSIFRFVEYGLNAKKPVHPLGDDVREDIQNVEKLLESVPHLLREREASSMTSHRFVSALTTVLDHLFDPVRSSVVRHLSRFAATLPNRIRGLNLDGVDDLCHVLEYAVGQAIDGIAQFQHDANALGLSGRGGYSRLIASVEWYIRSALIALGSNTELPLITFGLRTGNAGSTGRYQIDIPFNVLFVPSRWHIILHEVGHLAWIEIFGWMMESLAIYRALEKEIFVEIERDRREGTNRFQAAVQENPQEQVHVEILRTRELVRELFPSYLTFAIACAGNLEEFDELKLRPMLKASHPTSLSRDLLLRVVTHCLLEIMRDALDNDPSWRIEEDEDADRAAAEQKAAERAAKWWATWDPLRDEPNTKTDERVEDATDSIHETLLRIDAENRDMDARRRARREYDARHATRLTPNLAAAMHILHSDSFKIPVREALHSVITVLSIRGKHFQRVDADQIGPPQFGALLGRIARARRVEFDPEYELWLGRPFADWLNAGEVLTRHREAFDWSRLLLGSRQQLMQGDRRAFMRGQLSVLLSMWHAATTEEHRQYEELDEILLKLDVVREIEPTFVARNGKQESPRRTHSS